MSHEGQRATCGWIVGIHTRDPWAGHPEPCGSTRCVGPDPRALPRWEPLCAQHMALAREAHIRCPYCIVGRVVPTKRAEAGNMLDWRAAAPGDPWEITEACPDCSGSSLRNFGILPELCAGTNEREHADA